ncbi:MAG: SLC13 family permease [Dehalobacterium sp.]
MTQSKLARNKEITRFLIYAIICSLGWILPAPDPITPTGLKVLFVFVATVYGWTVTGHVWPSLFSCLMFPLTGVVTMKQFIAMGWGTDIFFFMILAFVLCKFLEEVGVSQFMASWLLSRKLLKGHPWRLITMILAAAYLISSLVNIFIGMLLIWEIIYTITNIIGQKPGDKFPSLMVFGVAMAGALSLSAMPWSGNAIVNLGVYGNLIGQTPNMVTYIAFSLPVGFASFLAYVALCKFVFKLDVTPLKTIKDEMIDPKHLELTLVKKIALLALIAFIVLLLLPSLLPQGPIVDFLNHFGVVGVIVLVFGILSLIKIDDNHIFNFGQLASKGIPWTMMIMVMVILSIGGCLMNPATGINDYLDANLAPILTSLSPLMFIIAITLITVLLTNFLINMVIVAMLLPIIISMSETLGINPEQISYLVMVASTIAILTPAASAASTILYPNKKWIQTKEIYRYGCVTVAVVTVLAILISYLTAAIIY